MDNKITAIGLAPLHGTVLSIIVGAFAAYSISTFLGLEKFLHDVFRVAIKINQIKVSGSYGLSSYSTYFGGRDEEERTKLVRKLQDLISGDTLTSGPPLENLPTDSSERGAEILKIISAISHHYPFPTRARPHEKGGVEGFQDPVVFRSVDEVEAWIKAVEEINIRVSWAFDNNKGKFNEYIQQFHQREVAEHQKVYGSRRPLAEVFRDSVSPGALQDIQEADKKLTNMGTYDFGTNLVKGFDLAIKEANDIALELKIRLEEYRIAKDHVPKKFWLFFTLGFASFSFLCAVILPMFFLNLPSVIWKGVPVAFYLWSLLLIIIKVVKL
ncbi:MAG TPA: hypothetical protein PKK23_06440 [Nitrospirales bacterium]|nr:hypothetical protein [Nitrospiraceae bacterium]HNP28663.1 hypothetical protein [Nitrospirales bacterium]